MNGWARAVGLAAAAGVVATACGPPPTVLAGRVREVPCGRPVLPTDPPDCTEPVDGKGVVALRDGVEVARTVTDAEGGYRLRLPAADASYTVHIDTGTPKPMWPDCKDETVTVTAGRTTRLNFRCGSGNR